MWLNADVGEHSAAECGGTPEDVDALLMPFLDLANIACGGHIGDRQSIQHALRCAQKYNVRVGAHPSYPDPENFGRRDMAISLAQLSASVQQQLRLFADLCAEERIAVFHIKAHGALYNRLMHDDACAQQFLHDCQNVLPMAAIMGQPDSMLQQHCDAKKITFIAEMFADRCYESDGRLRSRALDNAMIDDKKIALAQVLSVKQRGGLFSVDQQWVKMRADTVCVHGDNKQALHFVMALREVLSASEGDKT